MGLGTQTLHVGVNIPFVGGVEAGFFAGDGKGDANGLADLGGYLTFKKDYGGLMLAKAAVGYSKTLGCRDNFDGTSHEANLLPLAPEWIEAIKQKQTEKATW